MHRGVDLHWSLVELGLRRSHIWKHHTQFETVLCDRALQGLVLFCEAFFRLSNNFWHSWVHSKVRFFFNSSFNGFAILEKCWVNLRSKFLNPRKPRTCFTVVGTGHSHIPLSFPASIEIFPSSMIIPNHSIFVFPNSHFFGFKYRSFYCNRCRTFLIFSSSIFWSFAKRKISSI